MIDIHMDIHVCDSSHKLSELVLYKKRTISFIMMHEKNDFCHYDAISKMDITFVFKR